MGFDDDIMYEDGFANFDDWISFKQDQDEKSLNLHKKSIFDKYKNLLKTILLKKCINSTCDGQYVLKLNKSRQELFWGCNRFPKCKESLSLYNNVIIQNKCERCTGNLKLVNIKSTDFHIVCSNTMCNYIKICELPHDDF